MVGVPSLPGEQGDISNQAREEMNDLPPSIKKRKKMSEAARRRRKRERMTPM